MKKERIFQIVFIAVFVGYVLLQLFAPQPVNWTVTFFEKDKNPYGGFILAERLGDIFSEGTVSITDRTLFELDDEMDSDGQNFLVLSSNFGVTETDSAAISNLLDNGSSVFIGAEFMFGKLLDSVDIVTEPLLPLVDYIDQNDTISIYSSDSTEFSYPAKSVNYYFSKYNEEVYQPIAYNEDGFPVLLEYADDTTGGKLYLCSIPLIFTNYGLLVENNHHLASEYLSFLPDSDLHWTSYYQLGRNESATPFRYLLSQPPLKHALFVVLFSLFAVVLFESKRKQRAVPVFERLQNNSLEFIKVIGNLYYEKRENRNLALKRIALFRELLREKYFISLDNDEDVAARVAHKANLDQDFVTDVFIRINQIESGKSPDDHALRTLISDLELF